MVVEFTFNELQNAEMTHPGRRGFEQLLRKLLRLPGRPAVVVLHHWAAYFTGGNERSGGVFYTAGEQQLGVMAQVSRASDFARVRDGCGSGCCRPLEHLNSCTAGHCTASLVMLCYRSITTCPPCRCATPYSPCCKPTWRPSRQVELSRIPVDTPSICSPVGAVLCSGCAVDMSHPFHCC